MSPSISMLRETVSARSSDRIASCLASMQVKSSTAVERGLVTIPTITITRTIIQFKHPR
jgi:hypothetical protein